MKIPEVSWPAAAQPYDDDLLLTMKPGTVTLLIRGRNAWNSTWVRHYLKNAALFSDVRNAKLGAEPQRGPGNVFYVLEAPALLLKGRQSNVVLCDAHPDNPFGAFTGFDFTVQASSHGSWINGVFPGISIRDAVSAFGHSSGHWSGAAPSEHSLRTGLLRKAEDFDTARRSMESLVSRAIGSNYYLQWDASSTGNRYTLRGANAAARRWTKLVHDALGGSVSEVDLSSALAQYRTEGLRALPKSQWQDKKERTEVEKRAVREAARERAYDAADRFEELEAALWEAESEEASAREARLKPADTAAGVREQRERVERATAEFARIKAEVVRAETEADALWETFTQS